MNILFSTIGRRGYIADFFREHLPADSKLIGTSDRNGCDLEYTSGFFHCDKNHLLPSIKTEHEYIEALLKICKTEAVNMLFSFYDYDCYVLSKYLPAFEAIGVKPVVSSLEVNTICFDKFETCQFLKKQGFYTPWTVRADEIAQMDIPSFPVVVKPRFGFGSNGINYAHNREEVDFFLKYYAHEEMIVQEFIGGPEYSFDILNDFNANFVTAAVKKKIKMRSGETDQGYAFKDREMLDVARELGQRLGHIGPLDVDFFMKDGKPHILELNPRFGGGYAITHMAGLDFTKILIELYYGKLDPADYDHYSDYEEGIVMIKDILFHQANTKTK